MSIVFFLLLFLMMLIFGVSPAFGYHSGVGIGPLKFANDTHSAITYAAYVMGQINKKDYPDLVRQDFRAAIFVGDSDEAEVHQGSDRLAQITKVGGKQNEFAWFGAPDLHWKQILTDYKNKKFKDVYHRIGVLLHITEDATVPAHVRITPHGLGNDEYFGTGPNAKSQSQPTFKNNRIPNALTFASQIGDDLFEQAVDNLASQNQIPSLGLKPRILPSPDLYLKTTREVMRRFLDSDPYWDRYWKKKNNFKSFGSYGGNGDTFGQGAKTLGQKETNLVAFAYNLAVAYTSGQLQVISKKLPPIAEGLSLSQAKFGQEGTNISFSVLENRTSKVRIKLTVADGRALVDTNGKVYNGQQEFNLEENLKAEELPYLSKFIIPWQGDVVNGTIPQGPGKITLSVLDGDGNLAKIATSDFEYLLPASKKGFLPDQTKKAPAKGGPPVVKYITNSQLHGSYEEVPHRYLLEVFANDPESRPLTYVWKINCGYFVGPTNNSKIEWRYNTPGECAEAVVTVVVKDGEDLTANKTQAVFQ